MRELVTFPQTVLRSLRLFLSLIGRAGRGAGLLALALSLATACCDRLAVISLTGAVDGKADFWRIDLIWVTAAVAAAFLIGRWARLVGLDLMERMVDRVLLAGMQRILASDCHAIGAGDSGLALTGMARRMRVDARQVAMALPSVAVMPITIIWLSLSEPSVLLIMGLFPVLAMTVAGRDISRLIAGQAVLAEAEAQFAQVIRRLLGDATPVRPIGMQPGAFATQALWPFVDDSTRAASLQARSQVRVAALLEWLAFVLVLLLFAFTYLEGEDLGWLPALLLVAATLPHARRAVAALMAVARLGAAAVRMDVLANGFPPAEPPPPPPPAVWKTITLAGLRVDAPGPGRQSIGPLDLTLERGEIIALTGPTTLDRATLLLVLCGLVPLDQGAVLVDGFPVPPAMLRGLCGAVLHRGQIPTPLPPFDPRLAGAAMARLGLPSDAFSAIDLSESERVRLAIVITVLENRPVLLLDERAAFIEPRYRPGFIETLHAVRESGRTCVVSTQDPQVIAACDRVVSMQDGVVLSAEAGR